VVLTAVRVVLF